LFFDLGLGFRLRLDGIRDFYSLTIDDVRQVSRTKMVCVRELIGPQFKELRGGLYANIE